MCPDLNSVQRQAERLYFLTVEKLNEMAPEVQGSPSSDGLSQQLLPGRTLLPLRSEMLAVGLSVTWALECLSSSGRLPELDRLLSFAQSVDAGPVAFTTICCSLAQMASVLVLLGSGEIDMALAGLENFETEEERSSTVPSTSQKTPLKLATGTSSTTPGSPKKTHQRSAVLPDMKPIRVRSSKGRKKKAKKRTKRGSASQGKKPVVDQK